MSFSSQIQTTHNELKLLSLTELLKLDYRVEYIINPILPKNESLLIVGKSGCGKSTLTMQIAADVLDPAQAMFLGAFPIDNTNRPRRVLIIQAENHGGGLRQRYTAMLNHRSPSSQAAIENGLYFMSLGNTGKVYGDLNTPAFLKKIEDALQRGAFDLVILDPLASFHSGEEYNNEQMRRVLDGFQRVTDAHKATLIVVHHDGKSSQNSTGGRGASSIGDWAANTWQIRNNKGNYELENLKARNSALHSGTIKLNLNNSMFMASSTAPKRIDADLEYVVKTLHAMGGTANSKGILVEQVGKILQADGKSNSQNIVRPLVDRAEASGLIVQVKLGKTLSYKLP